MKNLHILLPCLLISPFVFAKDTRTLSCTTQTSYITAPISFDLKLDSSWIIGNEEKPHKDETGTFSGTTDTVIEWSQSECEESSSLVFDHKEYQELLSGAKKLITGHLDHSESDVQIQGDIECSLK